MSREHSLLAQLVDRLSATVACFLLWASRFGVHGDAPSRSFRAACWTATYLTLLLYTLASVVTFYSVGLNFAAWIGSLGLCPGQASGTCAGVGIVEFVVFVVPAFIFSISVRRRYMSQVGARARGVEYLLYMLVGVGLLAMIVALFWRLTATISLFAQLCFWALLFRAGGQLATQQKASLLK